MRTVFIANEDHKRFFDMLARSMRSLTRSDGHVRELACDMGRARIVSAREIPRNVVALYSWVRLRMSGTGHEITCQLVLPAEAHPRDGRISVLSPVGASILGHRVGETVSVQEKWQATVLGVFHRPCPEREETEGLEAGVA